MKTYIRAGIVLLAIVPIVTLASIDYNLKYGQKTPEVRELQDFLIDTGALPEGNNTGYFGVKTLKAVKQYQANNNLPTTGYVGVLTRGAINNELAEITASSTEQEIAETGTIATTTPVVQAPINSQPIIQYITNYATPVSQETVTQPTKMEVTITTPVFTTNPKPNSSKYLGTFTVSDTSKNVLLTYYGTSTSGEYTKGGLEYAPNRPYEIYWESLGTFNYKIDYNNGEATKEGTFTITE